MAPRVLRKKRTVHLLFLDVEGYSSLRSDREFKAFLEQVLPEIGQILRKYSPDYVNSWGDAIFAIFRTTIDATKCGLDLRDYFRNTNWDNYGITRALSCRVALHTGGVYFGYDAVQKRLGVAGYNVNLAARIEPITVPGQVFASETFVSILREDLEADKDQTIEFGSLGHTALAKEWGVRTIFRIFRAQEPKTISLRSLGVRGVGDRFIEFMDNLYQVTKNRIGTYFEEVRFTFYVEPDTNDRIIRECKITPIRQPILWRKLSLGARGDVLGAKSLDDLRVTCRTNKGQLFCLPVDESDPRMLEAVLFFSPPIQRREIRKFKIEYAWPGLWDPLRNSGKDSGTFTVGHDNVTSWDQKIIFPRGYRNVRLESRDPEVGTVRRFRDSQKRIGLRWHLEKPSKGRYNYVVAADR